MNKELAAVDALPSEQDGDAAFAAEEPSSGEFAGRDPRWNLLMFAATVVSVFWAGREQMIASGLIDREAANWVSGWPFAVPFLLILLFHEFGHFLAAVAHRVPASLPYFLPLPLVSPFGTLGAVIVMPGRIRSRNALLDIGAAGPLAGMLIAIPTVMVGLALSEVKPQAAGGYIQEGQSLLYWLLKRITLGPMPEGHDVYLHPTAFAGWAGFLITMINMLPWGQLDGGHIAYALFGEKHHGFALWIRRALPLLFLYNLFLFVWPVYQGRLQMTYGNAVSNSMFWLFWFFITGVMGRFFGGAQHPPCEPGELSPNRRWVALGTLVMFILLFMPTPFAFYE